MNIKKTLLIGLVIVTVIALIFVIVNNSKEIKDTSNLEKVRVQAGWIINGEFASICSAMLMGYYQDEGIEVDLIPGGPSGASFILATNAIAQDATLTIGIEGDTVPLIRGRSKASGDEQLKVKAFGTLWNENPYGFIVRNDSGLNSINDFIKRKPDGTRYKIGVTSDSIIQNAIARSLGVSVKDMDIVIVGYDATPYLTGQVDAMAGFWTSLLYEAEVAKLPSKFISASEIPGFSQPALVLEASEKTLADKPDTLVRWMKATIKGVEYVKKNPELAANHIVDMRCGGSMLNKDQELWLIKESSKLFDKKRIGWIDEKQVDNFSKIFHSLDQIPFAIPSSDIIDYKILNSLYW